MKKLILFFLAVGFSSSLVFSQTCKCSPSGWQPGTAKFNNTLKPIKCGYQFTLKCNDVITITEEYKCLGGCAAKYSAVLKNSMGAVAMSFPSFSFPWTYHFAAAGYYALEITPMCGDSKCTPCRFFFTVTCPPSCECNENGWQPFNAIVGNQPSQIVNCNFQFAVKKGQSLKLIGKYLCNGNCTAKYIATLKNKVTGAVVQNYPAFTFPWVYSFLTPGSYQLEITPICGDKRCTPCVFYFKVT